MENYALRKGRELVGNFLTVLAAGGESPPMMFDVCAKC